MTNRAAATRYARALLEVSQTDSDPEQVERDLSGFVELMSSHPQLGDSLVNPGIPPALKRSLMAELLPRLGEIAAPAHRLLVLLADRDRLPLLGEILESYRDRLMQLRGVVRARITTSSELLPERVAAIATTLESATGKQVEVETGVDSALLGGMVTQIGSTVYDGSLAGHLERLRSHFLKEA